MAEFSNLPTEVVKIFLLQLVPPDIFPLCRLNNNLNDICSDDIFWLDVARKYFPTASKHTITWRQLVKDLSKPEILTVRGKGKSGHRPLLGKLSLNKFSTLKDLWIIYRRLTQRLFLPNTRILSDRSIMDFPISTDDVYIKLFFPSDRGLEWRNCQIQETADPQKFIVKSYENTWKTTLNNDYLINITLDKIWGNKFKKVPIPTLFEALFDLTIISS